MTSKKNFILRLFDYIDNMGAERNRKRAELLGKNPDEFVPIGDRLLKKMGREDLTKLPTKSEEIQESDDK